MKKINKINLISLLAFSALFAMPSNGKEVRALEEVEPTIIKKETIEFPTSGEITPGFYDINKNIQLTGNIYAESGSVEINLNEYMLDLNGYQIFSDSKLSIYGTSRAYKREITLRNGKITECYGAVIYGGNGLDGGAIYSSDDLHLECINIYSCKAKNSGGAIYNGDDAYLVDVSIVDCIASDGGAIYNNDDLYISNKNADYSLTKISGNVAFNNGGGIYNCKNVEITSGVEINGNNAYQSGGGIYSTGWINMANKYVSDTIYRSRTRNIISENIASNGSGGGIYNSGRCNIGNAQIVSNTVSNNGGGIYNSGDMEIDPHSNISKNTASNDGGGIYNVGLLNGYIYKKNDIEQLSISENVASNGSGGGIYNVSDGEVTLTGTSFFSNSCNQNGGGIYNEGRFKAISETDSEEREGTDGSLFTFYRYYQTSFKSNTSLNGGGIYNCGLAILYGTIINSNKAKGYGGGIYNSLNLIISENEFLVFKELSTEIIENTSGSYGGGIYNKGNLRSEDGCALEVVGNSSLLGGGISNETSSSSLILGGKGIYITNNTSTNRGGGILYKDGTFEIHGDTVNIIKNISGDDKENNIYICTGKKINSISSKTGTIGVVTEEEPSSSFPVEFVNELSSGVYIQPYKSNYYVYENKIVLRIEANDSEFSNTAGWIILLEIIILLSIGTISVFFLAKKARGEEE